MANLVPEPLHTQKNSSSPKAPTMDSIKQRNSLLKKYKLTGNFKYTRNKITSELRKAFFMKLHHADFLETVQNSQ